AAAVLRGLPMGGRGIRDAGLDRIPPPGVLASGVRVRWAVLGQWQWMGIAGHPAGAGGRARAVAAATMALGVLRLLRGAPGVAGRLCALAALTQGTHRGGELLPATSLEYCRTLSSRCSAMTSTGCPRNTARRQRIASAE